MPKEEKRRTGLSCMSSVAYSLRWTRIQKDLLRTDRLSHSSPAISLSCFLSSYVSLFLFKMSSFVINTKPDVRKCSGRLSLTFSDVNRD